MKKFNIKSSKILVVLVLAGGLLLAAAIVVFAGAGREVAIVPSAVNETADFVESSYRAALVVHVSGEVNNPGVFWLYEGDRVWHAILAAGGLTEYADQNAVNLARRLRDEDHIVVFAVGDNMPATGLGVSVMSDGRVNINTATSEELQTLSGIGPVTAGNIVRHREARGRFESIDEIMNVSGIGPATFENIRDNIRVD